MNASASMSASRASAALFLATTLVALCASAAGPQSGAPPAYETWRNARGERADDMPGMKSNKGFGAAIHLVAASEAERFVREWNETSAEHAPKLTPADSVARGESVVLLILYAGCSAKSEGPAPCDATFDVKTLDPNGKALIEQFDIALARDLPAYPRIVQLSPVTLQTDFDATDPLGLYRYDVTLRNPERNAIVALTETIVLTDKASTPKASASKDASATAPTSR